MNVSRIVSLHVQSDVSPDAEIISAKKRNRKLKKRSSGLYLVRSGGTYLFQIRLPKRIGGGAGSRPIRVSLGALPHHQAREFADALGALARTLFRGIEKQMTGNPGQDASHITSAVMDEAFPADDWPFEFATLIFKAALFDMREPARVPTPEEVKGLEMMRGLVRIGREVAAKQAGEPHDEMIAENAEILAASHVAKYEAVAGPVSLPEQLYTSASVPEATGPDRPSSPSLLEPMTTPHTVAVPAGKRQRLIHSNAKAAFQLRSLDSNGDGMISSKDARFGELHLWHDRNADGIAQADEVLSLTDAGIRSLDLGATAVESNWAFGSTIVVNQGTYTRTDGTQMRYADVVLTAVNGSKGAEVSAALASLALDTSRAALAALGQFTASSSDQLQSWTSLLGAEPSGTATEGHDAQGGGDSARVLALMRQDMSTFGTKSGEGDANWRRADQLRPMDFFA